MDILILQSETDKTDYLKLVAEFIEANGVKTQEQLEQRFDILLTQFAMEHNGDYNAEKKILTIRKGNYVNQSN